MMLFSHGFGIGWATPTLNKLQSENSPLGFTVNYSEASWIGSLLGLGSLGGNIFCGSLMNVIGRKACIYILGIPHLCLWILAYFAKDATYLYAGRFLAGAAGGASYVMFPLFISEIADSRIRGRLSALVMLSVNLGVVFGTLIANELNYYLVPFVAMILPICYLLFALRLPETPFHLIRKQKYEQAMHSFSFYKNTQRVSTSSAYHQSCLEEFQNLKNSIASEQSGAKLQLSDFYTANALKAFLMALVLLVFNQCSGMFAFISYMTDIFVETGSTINPNICTMITAASQLLGSIAATFCVDRFGRRVIMIYTAAAIVLCLFGFGGFTYCASQLNATAVSWTLLLLMAIIIFSGSMGSAAVLFVLIVEILPSKIRSLGTMLCVSCLSLLVFATLKAFPICMHVLGLPVTMWSSGVICLFCVIYLFIFLKETKGKSMIDVPK